MTADLLEDDLSTAPWRGLPAAQQPDWPDPGALRTAHGVLAASPPLILPAECDVLRNRLAAVARGEALVLQGGDCAETFSGVGADAVRGTLRVLLQMAVVLTHASSLPVVKIGRMAGQFAKPRSRAVEERGGTVLPSYRGDAVNGLEFSARSRTPDPSRLNRTYEASAAVLNLIRALTTGGFADLSEIHAWNREFVSGSPAGGRYRRLTDEIERTLAFVRACGGDMGPLATAEFFVSHEALLLDYETPLTRVDERTGRLYATSGHLLWAGERTREPDGAHIEFLSRISNPVAVKLGPTADPETVLRLMDRLDPDREPGRLTFVVRAGADRVRDVLPVLVEKTAAEGARVCWLSDPMHGNTFTTPDGFKTRDVETILDEVSGFMAVHRSLGTHPGGIHVELTGGEVTECLGGGRPVGARDLGLRYESACDPRLNHEQSIDLAFRVADMYRRLPAG
ncbi:class II 3-deoxy-7-phosphoheptulonate synthase [Streptomyces sp. NBC_01363]|uniref:class II 3-deoxy-7-phosphoheptulonate synthase n=1 Tax=Streptomyces sp. NBC_01363 TaxID=2903840 RepID=UPI00225794AE|nr:3-deoxy-7-phosphoheptulonate synthase class II [Streptomyces sp. NBC_01363]MCX4733366.1 3-deoxy-7-phosphoheptulonate synthase class II [Streptomyces sp. NBC_01363]